MKGGGVPIVCVTAYDFPTARIADEAGVDIVLVGDSLGNVVLGLEDTLRVELSDMCRHTEAVSRGVQRALVVADLPFGSYQEGPAQAVRSSVALVKAGAHAVKLEGAPSDSVKAILDAGIPVMGHVGMTPQSVHRFGGFRVQGRGEAGASVLADAKALDSLGVFSMVIELVPMGLANELTAAVAAPTIGIGAGPHCDGQVQVLHDLIGLSGDTFRHAKRYVEAHQVLANAVRLYAEEVRSRQFPTTEHGFEDPAP